MLNPFLYQWDRGVPNCYIELSFKKNIEFLKEKGLSRKLKLIKWVDDLILKYSIFFFHNNYICNIKNNVVSTWNMNGVDLTKIWMPCVKGKRSVVLCKSSRNSLVVKTVSCQCVVE